MIVVIDKRKALRAVVRDNERAATRRKAGELRAARAETRETRTRTRATCSAARTSARELAEQARAAREGAKRTCAAGREETRAARAQEVVFALEYNAHRADLRGRRQAERSEAEREGRGRGRTSSATRRAEGIQRELQEVPPEFHALYRQHRKSFLGNPRKAPWEAFGEWLEEHSDEVERVRADAAEAYDWGAEAARYYGSAA